MAKAKVTTPEPQPGWKPVPPAPVALVPLVPPISVPWKSAPESADQTMEPPMFFPVVQDFSNLLTALRSVRSNQMFLQADCHTFREWCMKRFGERLGGWLEESL